MDPEAAAGYLQSTPFDEFGNLLMLAPTNDIMDPLNWPKIQKYTIVGIMCFSYFMLTYFTTVPAPSFTFL
jgi:hypothetical protein